MTKPYTESDLSNILDSDLTWRRRELSDMKAAIRAADMSAKPALLRALIAMGYAHWEGYIRTCAERYFEHLTLRKPRFVDLERQIYINSFLGKLDSMRHGRASYHERCELVNEILDSKNMRFSYLNPELIDTRSNLNTAVIKDICMICGVPAAYFEEKSTFLDVILLKRRNAIAHGRQQFIDKEEMDDFVADVLSLMTYFRNLIENKVYLRAYSA